MSISWLKASSDRKSFKIFESFGMDVYKINDLEKTDEKINNALSHLLCSRIWDRALFLFSVFWLHME